MGVVAKQSIKGALANYLGIAIGFFTTFFVVTDCLTEDEIGLTRVMVDAALLFSGLAQLGTNASILRFFPFFKDEKTKDHGFFGWTILLPFIGFSIFTALFFIFKQQIIGFYSGNSPMLVDYFYLLIPLTFFALYLTVFEVNASVLLHITVPKFTREVVIRLLNLVTYILYGKGVIGLDLFVILFCSSYAVATIVNVIYLFSLGKISFKIDFAFVDRKLLKEIGTYTLFMTATVLAGNIPLFNSLFISAKASLALTGIYTIASYIANIVEVPYRSLGAISQPLISQAMKDGNIQEVNRLGKKVSLMQFLVSCLIFFMIWINLDALFAVIPNGDKYIGGKYVVFFLGIAKIFNSSLSIGTNILNFSQKYIYSLPFIAVLTLSAIGFNYILIDLWGINGSACASLFAYLLYFGILLTFLNRKIGIQIFSRPQLTTLILMVGLFLLNKIWTLFIMPVSCGLFQQSITVLHHCIGGHEFGLIVDSLSRTVFMAIISVTLVYKLKISTDINEIIDKLLLKIHLRKSETQPKK